MDNLPEARKWKSHRKAPGSPTYAGERPRERTMRGFSHRRKSKSMQSNG
jgi:hypothetical protein